MRIGGRNELYTSLADATILDICRKYAGKPSVFGMARWTEMSGAVRRRKLVEIISASFLRPRVSGHDIRSPLVTLFHHPEMFFRRLAPTTGKIYNTWSRRRLAALLSGLVIISTAVLHVMRLLRPETGIKIPSHILMHSSELLVISLPNRQDRRRDMETLRMTLGLQWGYVDALSSDSPLVAIILRWVAAGRSIVPPALGDINIANFSWPGDLEAIAASSEEISLWIDGNSPWDSVASGFPLSTPYPPIVCATKDYTIATGLLPEHMILTPARVACWHSHLAVIQKLANNLRPHGSGIALIFEDDVDMEKDIDQQTHALWRTLPADWDIVFLGERGTLPGIEVKLNTIQGIAGRTKGAVFLWHRLLCQPLGSRRRRILGSMLLRVPNVPMHMLSLELARVGFFCSFDIHCLHTLEL